MFVSILCLCQIKVLSTYQTIISSHASYAKHEHPSAHANFPWFYPLASNRCQPRSSGRPSILLQGVLQNVCLDVVPTTEQIYTIGQHSSCRCIRIITTSAFFSSFIYDFFFELIHERNPKQILRLLSNFNISIKLFNCYRANLSCSSYLVSERNI